MSLTMNAIYNDSILESYKAPLPIRVNELIFQLKTRDAASLNATILTNGHVCLVNERKIYVWKLRKSFKVFSKINGFIRALHKRRIR